MAESVDCPFNEMTRHIFLSDLLMPFFFLAACEYPGFHQEVLVCFMSPGNVRTPSWLPPSRFLPLTDVMLPPAVVALHKRSANKSCHVMLIVSPNSTSVCQLSANDAIFWELPANYVFIIILCFHNLFLICVLCLVLCSLAARGPGKL